MRNKSCKMKTEHFNIYSNLFGQIAKVPKITKIAKIIAIIIIAVFIQKTNFVNAQDYQKQVPKSLPQIQLSFAPVITKVIPSVVNIYAITKRKPYHIEQLSSKDRFEGQVLQNKSKKNNKKTKTWKALGAGVIVRKDGIVVTNSHVVRNTQSIKVVTSDARQFNADIIYADDSNDIAILAIRSRKTNFPVLKIANSDKSQVGDIVLAIGNPFGIGQTVTSGIISALQRVKKIGNTYGSFLQTDAAINPGNSGGPLVNLNGEIVGINNAIYTQKNGSVGIGFAIPSNFVNRILQAVYKGKKPQYPYLAAVFNNINPRWAKTLGLPYNKGVIVENILGNSVLRKKGIKEGDVIIKVDGMIIENIRHLDFRLFSLGVGHIADFQFYRNGKAFNAKIKLQAPLKNRNNIFSEISINNKTFFSGVTIADISPTIASLFKIPINSKGVVITKVRPRSIAYNIGFKVGDLITEVSDNKIKNKNDFVRLSKRGKISSTIIRRGNKKYTITLKKQ